MATIRELVDAALSEVLGQAQTVDYTTYLAAPITATDLTVPVSSAAGFSRGMVQVDDELLLVDKVDWAANTLTLAYQTARGVRSTRPTPHPVGALVTMAPSVPRFRAVAAVADSFKGSDGLFRVGTTEFLFNASVAAYPLAPSADHVLHVSWFPPGPTKQWLPVRRWTWDRHEHLLVLGDRVQPGVPVRVKWTAVPYAPGQDEQFSASGLPESCADVIRLGAAWRMSSFIEPFNILGTRAESEAMDRQKVPGTRLKVAAYFYSLYAERLATEAMSLANEHPISVHFSAGW